MPDFVLLKMSNEMPAQIRRQLRDFRSRFLNTTLAEQSLPSLDRLAHFVGWMCLRDRDELNFARSASNLRRRSRDLLAHARKIFRDRSHRKNCRSGAPPANSKSAGGGFPGSSMREPFFV